MKRLIILIGMFVTLAFIGCTDKILSREDGLTDKEIRLSLSCQEFQEKSILPTGQTLAIASYDVTGTGPGSETFSSSFNENESHSFNLGRLAIGLWHLEAAAKNKEGTTLATGEVDIVFTSKTTEAALSLDTLSGKGNLSVTVSWEKDQVDKEDYELKATLKNQQGTTIEISPSVSEGSATITKQDLPSGSYILCLELLTQGVHVSGATSAIRIVDGALSSGQVPLVIGDKSNEFSLVIQNETSLPIQATVSSDPQTISAETTKIVLTVTPTNLSSLGLASGDLSYQWYHEGALIDGETSSSLTITEKKLGSHRYDVVITSTKPGSIGSVTITVNTPAS